MTATESIAAAINEIDEKKEKLKKAFDDLQCHRSLLSPSFNLSWSEIDSHFSSLQSSLFNRFRLLHSAAPHLDSVRIEASTADTTEAPLVWPELRTFCEKMDGKGLGKYMIDNSNKRLSMKDELSAAIRISANPTALVLDAIEGCYHYSPSSPSSSSSARKIDLGRVFVLLLEALSEIKANLTNDLRERARTLAYDWKSNMGNNKPSEALVFLHLVSFFELGSLFKTDELVDYIFLIGRNKEATTISKKIGLDNSRTAGLVKKFLHTGRLLVAIKFIYEFEMTGKFEPASVLKTSLKNSREGAKRVCTQGNNSIKAQNEAIDKELGALRKVIKVVKERNLESEFSEEKLEERIQELENKKAQRRNATKFFTPTANNPQKPQQQLNKKRPRVANGASNTILPPKSQQPPLLPNPSHSLQANPYGLVSSTISGVVPMNQRQPLPNPSHHLHANPYGLVTNGAAVPYGNPLALYGPAPVPASQQVHYEQQNGHGGYGWRPPYHPPYYHPQ